MPWIKIKDQLPPQITPILIEWRGEVQNITYELVYLDRGDGYYFTPHFFEDSETGPIDSKDVTQWRRIPGLGEKS